MAARNEVDIRVIARDMATRELNAASTALQNLGRSAQGAGTTTTSASNAASNSLNSLGASATNASFLAKNAAKVWDGAMLQIGMSIQGYVGKGVAIVSDAIIGFNARAEQAMIGFTTMLGSASKAQSFMEQLQDFAAATPFEFDGLRESANLIMAMGFEAKEVIPLLTAAGDAVAALGLGTEAVQRVVYALGQMKSAGRVTGQDMMQLASMGIPAWKMLADSIGMTVAEAKKAAEQGKIDAETAIKGITTAIEEGNMGGMMAAQARTFNGAMSTIKDTIAIVVASAFKPLFEELSGITLAVADFLGSADFLNWAEDVGAAIGEVIGMFMELGESLIPIAEVVVPAVIDGIGAVADGFMRVLPVVIDVVGFLVEGLGFLGPLVSGLIGPLTASAVAFGLASAAMGIFTGASGMLFAITNTKLFIGAYLQLSTIIPLLAPKLLLTAAGIRAAATAIYSALGPIGWLTIAIGALLTVLDVGDLIDDFAMDVGEMGESIKKTAEATDSSVKEIKSAVQELMDTLEVSFDDANYLLLTFGDQAELQGERVIGVMEQLEVGMTDSIAIIDSMGNSWRAQSEDMAAAIEATNISWEQTYDALFTMNAGMLSSEEILRRMNEAAAAGPEAWADLTDGIGAAEEVVEGAAAAAEQAKEDALNSIREMLDGFESLFSSEEDAIKAAEDFAAAVLNPFKDTEQTAALVRNLTMTEIPAAFTSGSTVASTQAAQFVEDMLTKFDVLHPGMLERGRDGGTGLFEGMEPSANEIITWAEETFGPQLVEGMTLDQAMRDAGFDNMADYIAGIEEKEQATYNAGYASGMSGLRGVKSTDYHPAGETNAGEYSGGLGSTRSQNVAREAGGRTGRAGRDGLHAATAAAAQWGETVALAWANGLGGPTATQAAAASAGILAAAGAHSLAGSSPPKGGPLMHIDRGGYNVGVAWADGITSSSEYAKLAGKSLAAALAAGIGEDTKLAISRAEKEIAAVVKKPAFTKAQLAAAGGNVKGAEASAYDTLMLMEMDARAAATRPTLLTGGLGGESTKAVSITNQFGAGSVRSDDDIYAISRKIAEQVRMESV